MKSESSSFGDPFDKTDFISAALYFMQSGDYLFRWKEHGVINQKCLAAPDVTAAFIKNEVDSGWIPAGIIRHGYGAAGSWAVLDVPPTREDLALFNPDGENEKISISLPRVIMVGVDRVYYLFALDGPFKPKAKSYYAPFTNVHSDGRICWGTNTPPVANAATISKAWRMFLDLPFNGDLKDGKSIKHKQDIRIAWRKYTRKNEWPVTDLVPYQQSIDQIVTQLVRSSDVH